MAFMMPVVRKNYNIYGDGRQRVSSAPDGTDSPRKTSKGSAGSQGRRRVRSEGTNLSTSPGNQEIIMKIPVNGSTKPVPIRMRRAKGSAPVLQASSVPFLRHNSLPGGHNSVPVGSVPTPKSPTHSTGSSSSSSSENSSGNRFKFKLLSRLKKSLRITGKDPVPAAS